MIIECGHCGAPLDVESGAETTRCEYCGISSRTHAARTVHPQTPSGWQPPTQWRPPEHMAADSTQILEYQARRAVRGLVFVAAGLVLALGVVTAVIIQITSTTSSSRTVRVSGMDLPRSAAEALKEATAQIEAAQRMTGTEAPEGPAFFLNSAAIDPMLTAYEEAVGGGALSLLQLTLHEEHSSIKAQSPHNPKHVDRYRYRGGQVGGSEAVRVSGLPRRNLAAHLFDPRKTALAELDRLKTVAFERLGYEEAEISHVIVSRDRGRGPEIRIYAGNERESGYVRFSARGEVVRVYR